MHSKNSTSGSPLKIALLCGGPSRERGISMNSARSVCDHLHSETIEVTPIYFDHDKNAYKVSRAQLYSNTPSDFDFKLHAFSKPFSKKELGEFLQNDIDLAFPVIHGRFGEDGEIQEFLEELNVPFIGSSSASCKSCFNKYDSNQSIAKNGFYTLPTMRLIDGEKDHKEKIEGFFKDENLNRAIVKPARGGSSIGVFSVTNPEEALEKVKQIIAEELDNEVVVQPFAKGVEFTVIVTQNRFGLPVALIPSEISTSYQQNQIFDYRKKYLPTNQVKYYCPPRFNDKHISNIQTDAEQIFQAFGMNDFARFDGWICDNGEIWFSDFNPVSGMEQNSFLFQQASILGMSHRDFLKYVTRNACERYKIPWPEEKVIKKSKKKPIHVLFGGNTAERQVSLMSGTNGWLKLKRSEKYNSIPYLLDIDHNVWRLPYYLALNHTVEEIVESCGRAHEYSDLMHRLRKEVLEKMSVNPGDISEEVFLPQKISLGEFVEIADFVFLGLHGGIGENGQLQKVLEEKGKYFNGSGSQSAMVCMDKYETAKRIAGLESEGVFSAKKTLIEVELLSELDSKGFEKFWDKLKEELHTKTVIVKPHSDGCSAGIIRLYNAKDLEKYIEILKEKTISIAPNTFTNQSNIIEMPTEPLDKLLFEEFIETDKVSVDKSNLIWKDVTGWVEITVGVLGKTDSIRALNSSITVASGEVLSLEEKFQGGTGVNITPPPESHVSKEIVEKAKKNIEKVAKSLGIYGYARIDAFMNIENGDLIIIEANSLPGLTPSTVIFHQGLVEEEQMYPLDMFSEIVELGYQRYND